MAQFNICRFCKDYNNPKTGTELVKYGTRHYAHYECYLEAGKKLSDLPAWQVGMFPYQLLKRYGKLEEATEICKPLHSIVNENR